MNPSGKLPFTFPRRIEDNPAYLYYSPGRDASYGEGVFVGYRYFDRRHIEPLLPIRTRSFVHHVRLPQSRACTRGAGAGGNVEVCRWTRCNTGQRARAENRAALRG